MENHSPEQALPNLSKVTIYSIGHSNHETEDFLELLREHQIEMVVDVRSSPYSRYVPQANRETMARSLHAAGIAYRWLGDSLGGKPQGVVGDYLAIRVSPAFQKGITQLLTLATDGRTAMMCSEGDHRACHRHRLITPVLLERGIRILHIQPDGSIVDEHAEPRQLMLAQPSRAARETQD